MSARAERWLAWLVVLGAVLAHAGGLAGGFVYDDHRFVVHNPALERLDPWGFLHDPATASAATGDGISADIYRPLRTLLFAVERQLLGLAPLGWHLVSVALHGLNAWLLLRLLRSLLPGAGAAAPLAVLLVVAHPVTVESVAWISSQGDLLALTLMLLVLEVLRRPGPGAALAGAGLALLACLAKESALVLPALLLLRDLALPREAALPRAATTRRTALLAGAVLGYLLLRQAVLPGLAQVPHPGDSVLASVRGFLAAVTWYAGSLLWPTGFRFETDLLVPLSAGDSSVVLGVGLLLSLLLGGLAALRAPRPRPGLFAAWGLLAALGPVSQVLVPLKTLAAERFLLPCLPALAVGAGLLLARLRARRGGWALAGAAALLVPLVLVTWTRSGAYEDDEALWDAVRRDRPSNGRAYHGLAEALFAKNRFSEATAAYQTYLQAWRYDGKARRQLADHVAGWVATLRSDRPEVEATSGLAQRRRELKVFQVALLASALDVWDEVGYAAGRGSPAMYDDTLERLVDVAVDVGDLARARWGLNRRLERAGLDPGPDGVARVLAQAPFPLRLMRFYLAWKAVTTEGGRALPAEQEAERLRQRADAVRDVGLDPYREDGVLVRDLEPLLVDLRREAARQRAAGAGPRAAALDDKLTLLHAELLERTGRGDEAAARRAEVLRRQAAGEAAR